MALEVLGWNQDETRFPVEGRVLFTQPNDANWKIMVRTVKMNPIQAILCVMCSEELPEVTTNKELIFPPDTATIREACLIMVREKSGKYTLVRVSTYAILYLIYSGLLTIFRMEQSQNEVKKKFQNHCALDFFPDFFPFVHALFIALFFHFLSHSV